MQYAVETARYNVIQRSMTSFDTRSRISQFLKKSPEITEINTKSSQNSYEMYKKMQNCLKNIYFWSNLTYTELNGSHGNVK